MKNDILFRSAHRNSSCGVLDIASGIPTASRQSGNPLPKHPDQLLDVLDALAAICVRDKGDVFFVSLAMNPNSATLCVSTNGTVPATLTTHLRKIRGQLKKLKSVVEPGLPTSADIESPDSNNARLRMEGELELQRTIYEYSYEKLQRRFHKRGPGILARYDDITKGLEAKNIAADTEILAITRVLLRDIEDWLKPDAKPQEPYLILLIDTIAAMSKGWRTCLEDTGDENVLTRWDDLTRESGLASRIYDTSSSLFLLVVKQNRKLSLRRCLQKLFTLHHHIQSILRIAWSSRLSPFLEGQFDIMAVLAAPSDISIQFSQQQVLHVAFPPEDKTAQDVRKKVYDQLLIRLQTKADKEGIDWKMKTGSPPELSLTKINVHAECSLLAYHLQNPGILPYHYFGGSKLSCHACGVLFSAFNGVAKSFDLPRFFTKGCSNKLYLQWPCPSLLLQEQQKQLRPDASSWSLDIQVREEMNKVFGDELVAYVGELRKVVEASTPPHSDGISASGESRESEVDDSDLEDMRRMAGGRYE
jgi:hypothetical protein